MLGVTGGACSPAEVCQGACLTRACPTFSIHCVTNGSVPGALLSLQNSEEKVKKVSLVCSKPGGRIMPFWHLCSTGGRVLSLGMAPGRMPGVGRGCHAARGSFKQPGVLESKPSAMSGLLLKICFHSRIFPFPPLLFFHPHTVHFIFFPPLPPPFRELFSNARKGEIRGEEE